MVMRGVERRVAEQDVLIREGSPAESMCIVLDGLFSVLPLTQDGRPTAAVAPGNLIGELSLFTGEPSGSTIVAAEPSLVLEVSKDVLEEKLNHDHEFAADFSRVLLSHTSRVLSDTMLKLHAAEHALTMDIVLDPLVRKAQGEIDQFKKMMLELDKEAMKQGRITEDPYRQFSDRARGLMGVCREVLGMNSPLDDIAKKQISARLQHEMLPYVLTTETAERFYSRPRGYGGDYLAIHKIYQNVPSGTGRLTRSWTGCSSRARRRSPCGTGGNWSRKKSAGLSIRKPTERRRSSAWPAVRPRKSSTRSKGSRTRAV